MVDIQSAAAEIRRGKKIETTGQGGHNNTHTRIYRAPKSTSESEAC